MGLKECSRLVKVGRGVLTTGGINRRCLGTIQQSCVLPTISPLPRRAAVGAKRCCGADLTEQSLSQNQVAPLSDHRESDHSSRAATAAFPVPPALSSPLPEVDDLI